MPYLAVHGIRLRYETWGVGARPVVLLHGLGSSADDWLLQLPDLARHYRCYAPDLRGHGLSDKPPGPYSVPQFAADMQALLDVLQVDEAHFVGLSLGGLVAQQIAIAYPAMVRSLVLINTFPGLWPLPWPMVRVGARRLAALPRRQGMAETAANIARDLFPEPEQAAIRATAEARMALNDPRAYRSSMSAIMRFRPGPALAQVRCPVLIMAGELDPVVPLIYKQRLRKMLPQSEYLLVPGSRHASNVDRPEVVNRALLDFLQAADGKTAEDG